MSANIVGWLQTRYDNIWSATLAGDLAQTALLRRKGQTYVGPDGQWFNSSICPTKFLLKTRHQGGDKMTLSHLTVAEVNGGIDGLLLGLHFKDRINDAPKLSQIIDRYYLNVGNTRKSEAAITDFDLVDYYRYHRYLSIVNEQELANQALKFGMEYRSSLLLQISEPSLEQSIVNALHEMSDEIRLLKDVTNVEELTSYLTNSGPIASSPNNDLDSPFFWRGLADVSLVLDSSVVDFDEVRYMRSVAAAVALQLDIWSFVHPSSGRTVDLGSRFEVSDGRFGRVEHSTFNEGIPAEISCQILADAWRDNADGQWTQGSDVNPSTSLMAAAARMAQRRHEDITSGTSFGRAQVVALFLFGRLSQNQQRDLRMTVRRLSDMNPELQLMIVTRWAPWYEFRTLVRDPERDIVSLRQQVDNYGYEDEFETAALQDARIIGDRLMSIPGQMSFPSDCRFENLQVYVDPGTRRTLELQPFYFAFSDTVRMTFSADFNGVKICAKWFSQGSSQPTDRCETVSPGGGKSATFTFDSPCQDSMISRSCAPIFFTISAMDVVAASTQRNCRMELESRAGTRAWSPCRTPETARVTVTHSGLTCGSGNLSISILIILVVPIMHLAF